MASDLSPPSPGAFCPQTHLHPHCTFPVPPDPLTSPLLTPGAPRPPFLIPSAPRPPSSPSAHQDPATVAASSAQGPAASYPSAYLTLAPIPSSRSPGLSLLPPLAPPERSESLSFDPAALPPHARSPLSLTACSLYGTRPRPRLLAKSLLLELPRRGAPRAPASPRPPLPSRQTAPRRPLLHCAAPPDLYVENLSNLCTNP